ncbi:hypothetical protein EP7_003572 [Isosphaeraceae bacterium EP7]
MTNRQQPGQSEVEAAVRAVLAGMGLLGGRPRASELATVTAAGVEPYAGRLFGARQVESLSAETREIQLAPATIITPLARDLLKRLGITVTRVARLKVERPGEWGFGVEVESGVTESIRRTWLDSPVLWTDLGPDVDEVARWISDGSDRGALVLTPQASVAHWRASQVAEVRAATVNDGDSVARAIRFLGANLLVIEPAGRTIHELKSVADAFRAGGAPRRPDWLAGTVGLGSLGHADRRGDRTGDALQAASQLARGPVPAGLADDLRGPDGRLALTRGGGHRV